MPAMDANMADAHQEPSSRISSIHQPGLNVEWPHTAEDRYDSRDIHMLRKEVQQLLGRRAGGFAGAQPVSFQREHVAKLKQEDYYVCEKSDGVRYLLWLTINDMGGECQYLIDRKNQYWCVRRLGLHFPLPDDKVAFHKNTLIDGELVEDDIGNGRKEPTFLVFDCLVLGGKPLMERTLDKRLAYFQANIFKPYRDLLKQYPEEKPFQAFLVEMKEMQFSYGLEMMFREVLPNLKHGNDGLIFTCRNTPYCFGTDQHILKWKPANENTIDFKMRLQFATVEPDEQDLAEGATGPYPDYDSIPSVGLWAFRGGSGASSNNGAYRDAADNPYGPQYEKIGDLFLLPDEWETLKSLDDPLSDRVVECGLDDEDRWRLYRFRDDKHEPNHVSVVRSVMNSIQNAVSEHDLLFEAKSIKDCWKARQVQQQQQQGPRR